MSATKAQRAAAVVVAVMLLAGFAYSGVATIRQYVTLFQIPAMTGTAATIDAYVAPVNLRSGEALRAAVRSAGWPLADDIVIVAQISSLSGQDIRQIQFAASYLLYPSPVLLALWCDPAASEAACRIPLDSPSKLVAFASVHGPRHVLLVGRSNPFSGASTRPVTDIFSLVELH
jgi:hypothetical protein